MTARRYLAVGLLAFAAFTIAFAPASLATLVLARQLPGASLTETRGTVWSGSTRIGYDTATLGRLHWQFRPASLLTARVVYDGTFEAGEDRIDARLYAGVFSVDLELAGTLSAVHIDPLLARYDISLPGTLRVDQLRIHQSRHAALPFVRGEVKWSGGDVHYRLGSSGYDARLPPMIAFIDSSAGQPEMSVYAVEDETPLMLARMADDGWITIGVTKRLTQMTGQPWHGDQPEHAVVVEVQEKLF
jgi:hypothetical protein